MDGWIEIREKIVELSKIECSTRPYLKKLLDGLEKCEELPYPNGKYMHEFWYRYFMFMCFLFLDARDNICLELLTRLLYPRGLGKNAVFMKKHEVVNNFTNI